MKGIQHLYQSRKTTPVNQSMHQRCIADQKFCTSDSLAPRIFLHLGLEHEPLRLGQELLALGEQEPDLLRRQAHDPALKSRYLDALHLIPATSRFELDRPLHRGPLPIFVRGIDLKLGQSD